MMKFACSSNLTAWTPLEKFKNAKEAYDENKKTSKSRPWTKVIAVFCDPSCHEKVLKSRPRLMRTIPEFLKHMEEVERVGFPAFDV